MATGAELAKVAQEQLGKGYTYEDMDCQGFVEFCLRKLGIRKNWKGSNHMWREALSWKGTVSECIARYGSVPAGAWLFTIKQDGGEKARGYNDAEGNAAHVGIYTGMGKGSVHSSTGGVQEGDFPAKRWTHVGLPSCLDYGTSAPPSDHMSRIRAGLLELLDIVESAING